MSHKQIPQADAEIEEKGRFPSLFMVFFSAQYGASPVKLFKEEKPAHLMGQSESGQGQYLVSPIQKRFRQTQRTPDYKADPPSRTGGKPIKPGRQLFGLKLVPRTIKRNKVIPGRQPSGDRLPLCTEDLLFRSAFLNLGWFHFNPFHLDILSEPLQIEGLSLL